MMALSVASFVAGCATMPEPEILPIGTFPADLHGMRRCLPDQWAAFLKSHFDGNATRIASVFECDHKTARDWLGGKHVAAAPTVLHAIRTMPATRVFFLEDVA